MNILVMMKTNSAALPDTSGGFFIKVELSKLIDWFKRGTKTFMMWGVAMALFYPP